MIQRTVIIELIGQKLPTAKIAARFGCSARTVAYWEHMYGFGPAFASRGRGRRTRTPKEFAAEMVRESVGYRRRLKTKAIAYKGGKCRLCGHNRYNGALEFHHLDKTSKGFGFSRKGLIRSWESIKTELDKCILVCANCHQVEGGVRTILASSNM